MAKRTEAISNRILTSALNKRKGFSDWFRSDKEETTPRRIASVGVFVENAKISEKTGVNAIAWFLDTNSIETLW
jgi:hypothetical protein